MQKFNDIRYEVEGPIAYLTLDRPSARNAYSQAMIDSIVGALDEAEDDDAVRCVVLTGEGSCFSAGGDLKAMRDHSGMFAGDAVHLRANYMRTIHRIPRRFSRFDKPVIAAINGPAIGAGLDLTCMCDLRIASATARFGSTFVKVGLVPGDGGAFLLSRVVGFPKALELVLTARVIDAQEALRIGLIAEAVAPDALKDRATEIALELAGNPPLAVRMAKSACYQSWGMELEGALNVAATYQSIVQNTPEHDERVDALLNRRR